MFEQLSAINFATTRLIEGKGKHSVQYSLMEEELQNQFVSLKMILGSIQSRYECFLWDTIQEDEQLGKKFLPVFLHERVPLVVASQKGELV